jgi:chromate transporter
MEAPIEKPRVTILEIFLTFLAIGATSFGGGVVAYLRSSLVTKKQWLDDEGFLAALEISQALPGLNATNMSVIVGDRLRGLPGAVAGFVGITLPGALLVFVIGLFYATNANNPWVNAALKGVGAASVGLLLAVTLQIGHKQLEHRLDVALVALTLVLVSFLHVPLAYVLLTVGPLAIFLYRPRHTAPLQPDRSGLDKKPVD